jgi:hypothetical protein
MMSEWKSITEIPDNFCGDVWVFSKHLEKPELANTYRAIWGMNQDKRVFQSIYSANDSEGLNAEYFKDVSHYMEVIPPAPPTEVTGQ